MIKKVFKENPLRVTIASFCILLFIGLQIREGSAPLSTTGWNAKEISRIRVRNPKDFTFAVLGDNKGNRFFFEPLLQDIDRSGEMAFAIDVGDLVDGGSQGNYRKFLEQLHQNLNVPFLAAVGNHDLYKGSLRIYENIFGASYYTFHVGEAYFIVLDATAESGFDQRERQWLEGELQRGQAYKARFVFMHVPPFDPRGNGFDKCLPEKDRKDLLDLFRRYNVTHLFASHIHGYFSGVWEGIHFTVTGGGGAPLQGSDPDHFFHHYIKVHLNDGKAETFVRPIDNKDRMNSYFIWAKDFLFEWGFLFIAVILLLTLVHSKSHRASFFS